MMGSPISVRPRTFRLFGRSQTEAAAMRRMCRVTYETAAAFMEDIAALEERIALARKDGELRTLERRLDRLKRESFVHLATQPGKAHG